MNIVEIAGHLGADPEVRHTPNGQKVTTLRVATNVRKSGQDHTIWWRVTLWGDQFDRMLSYLKKGSAIIVVGEMQPPNIYNDRSGQPAVSLEIRGELLRFNPFPKGQAGEEQGGSSPYGQQASSSQGGYQGQPMQGSGQNYNSGFSEDPTPSASDFSTAPIGGQADAGAYDDDAVDDNLPF